MNRHEQLLNHMRRFTTLIDTDEQLLTAKIKYVKLDRKEFLLHEFQVCTAYYFVLSGCLRLYRNTDSGYEQILQFGIPGWWLSDFHSFENKMPSEYSIQAVHKTEILVLYKSDFDELFSNIPALNSYFRYMMQRAYTASLKRIELMLCDSAETRYTRFIGTFPDFVQGIPQYMLASFLGFTPQFLSKLRARKNI